MERKPSGSDEISTVPREVIDDGESALAEEEEEEEEELGDGWDDWNNEEEEAEADLLCLFCDSRFSSADALFTHCGSDHCFDFQSIRKELELDFYGCVKLINYIRAQVEDNNCWGCGVAFHSRKELSDHLQVHWKFEKGKRLIWEDDKYLQPFMLDDALLHCFADDGDDDNEGSEEYPMLCDDEELLREIGGGCDFSDCIENGKSPVAHSFVQCSRNEDRARSSKANGNFKENDPFEKDTSDDVAKKDIVAPCHQPKDRNLKVSFANVAAKEMKSVNDSYFGSYGSFSIHREMLSDKARMDAYRGALLNNPSLMKHATVMDVGCGTGILSLFAAKAGASSVIAVEASEKMASMAKQIINDNGLLYGDNRQTGVIRVVNGMVEELDRLVQIPQHSIDVLVSEWMGYCLLFESMLNSVLYARDHWLKPGGAILPDTATMSVAGFGKGGTSLSFWENVYGFDMSRIGKEVLEDSTQAPIVDVVDSHDIVTDAAVLHKFDLATMKPDEVDFTSTVELQPKSSLPIDSSCTKNGITWCYGMVLWFETGFTNRFCREMPTVLSTSPYSQKTHWSQTIFTFSEPIAMSSSSPRCIPNTTADIGTEGCPATRIRARISIARASVHRSIDISLEVTGVTVNGQKHNFPVQIFNL